MVCHKGSPKPCSGIWTLIWGNETSQKDFFVCVLRQGLPVPLTHYVDEADLKLIVIILPQPPSDGVTGVHHHAQHHRRIPGHEKYGVRPESWVATETLWTRGG